MKSWHKVVFFVSCFLVSMSAQAQFKNRLEFGPGVFQAAKGVDLLFRVENTSTIGEQSHANDFFVAVSVKGDAAFGSNKFTYLDFSFQTLLGGDIEGDQGRIYLGYTPVSATYEKNLYNDLDYITKVSFVGFKVGGQVNVGDEKALQLFAQASIDLFGFYDVKRRQDGAALSPARFGDRYREGANVQVGAEWNHKIRVTLGADFQTIGAVGVPDGTESCNIYYDDYGYPYELCTEVTSYLERWQRNKFFVETSVNLNRSLSVFGRASYGVFSLTDDTGYFPNSSDKKWNFEVGAKYRFVTSKKQ